MSASAVTVASVDATSSSQPGRRKVKNCPGCQCSAAGGEGGLGVLDGSGKAQDKVAKMRRDRGRRQ